LLLVGDAHGHVNPVKGIGPSKLARRFKSSGGWFMAVSSLLSWSYRGLAKRVEDYVEVFKLNVEAVEEMRREGLACAAIIGVHPAELVRLVESGVSLEEAERLVKEAYDAAARMVKDGLAQGLGEVGRPHFPSPRAVVEACNRVLDHALELAHDLDCPVHIHVERGGPRTVEDVARRARAKGAAKALLHHAEPSAWALASSLGLAASIPARSRDLLEALRGPRPLSFLVESDFLDDPRRPGAVVAPWSIASTFEGLIKRGALTAEEAWRVLVDNVARFYGLEPP